MELDGASSGGLIRSLAFAGPVAAVWWAGLAASWELGAWWAATAWTLLAGPALVLVGFGLEFVLGRWLVDRGLGSASPAVVWSAADHDHLR
jgi:hypothetical protein